MPSVPSFPGARREAERPTAAREYEAYDWLEGYEFTVVAGAGFQTAVTFSGQPDRVTIKNVGGQLRIRFRNPGEAPHQGVVLRANTEDDFRAAGRILEVQDPAAAGGQFISGVAYYGSRAIERRASRRGPLASDVRPRDQGYPEQLDPR